MLRPAPGTPNARNWRDGPVQHEDRFLALFARS